MSGISDLTRDIRPELEEILVNSIYETAEIDRKRENFDGPVIEEENNTFYWRTISLFMKVAPLYYTVGEIESWVKKELLNEVSLPKVDGFKIDSP